MKKENNCLKGRKNHLWRRKGNGELKNICRFCNKEQLRNGLSHKG